MTDALRELGIEPPPSGAELPYDDGEPLASDRRRLLPLVLAESLELAWRHRRDVHAGANLGIYGSLLQAQNQDYRVRIDGGRGSGTQQRHRRAHPRGPQYVIVDSCAHRVDACGLDPAEMAYVPLAPNEDGRFASRQLGLRLGWWSR